MFTTHRKVAAGDFEPITDGLLGWWKMDETTGPVTADSSPYVHDGTLVNSPTWVIPGRNGSASALSFNGVDNYVDIPDKSAFNNMHQANVFTFCAWIKVTDREGASDFLAGSTVTSGEIGFMYIARGAGQTLPVVSLCYDFSVFRGTATYCIVQGSTEEGSLAADNEWAHVCAIANKPVTDIVGFYINGVAVNSSKGINANFTTSVGGDATRSARFGSSNYSSFFGMNGSLDDIRYYNRVLSASEISSIYNGNG